MLRKFEKVTIRWIKLSTFRATHPWSVIKGFKFTFGTSVTTSISQVSLLVMPSCDS